MEEQTKLNESSREDLQDVPAVVDELSGFEFGYFFSGRRVKPGSKMVELAVVTWIRDVMENQFLRKCTYYMGPGKLWKITVERQLRRHMKDVEVSDGFIQSELRFFEAEKELYLEPEAFEKKFLELKRRMKNRKL